jgi:hypothetical protein
MITKAQIATLLTTNDKAVGRALMALHNRQTKTEQFSKSTSNLNGRGFTPADAHMGSSMAVFYSAVGTLTQKQLAYWRKPNAKGVPRICKYAAQLLEVAKEKVDSVA